MGFFQNFRTRRKKRYLVKKIKSIHDEIELLKTEEQAARIKVKTSENLIANKKVRLAELKTRYEKSNDIESESILNDIIVLENDIKSEELRLDLDKGQQTRFENLVDAKELKHDQAIRDLKTLVVNFTSADIGDIYKGVYKEGQKTTEQNTAIEDAKNVAIKGLKTGPNEAERRKNEYRKQREGAQTGQAKGGSGYDTPLNTSERQSTT